MGTNLKDLIEFQEVNFGFFKNRILVVDSFNVLYQFLSSIRQRDGELLKDSKGNVTSHLVGLFNRTTKLMQYGIKPAFVFDGESPKLKQIERARRKELKIKAVEMYDDAKKRDDVEDMKKFASRTSRLTHDMIEEAKQLINALGCPVIQAPSEGEAQAAHIVSKGEAYAVVSEDYDSLLYGAVRTVKNLTISGRKKVKDKLSYKVVQPCIVNLSENLNRLGIDREQLICLAMLIGTDFNVGGIKGIGPKKAYKLVLEYKKDFDAMFKSAGWSFNYDWTEVFDLINEMPVNNDYTLDWKSINEEKLNKVLIEKHEFSEDRVNITLKRLNKINAEKQQKGLKDFF